jgi:PAS domain S-box-containing protein
MTTYDHVYDNSHQPMMVVDKDSMSILDVNDLAVESLGYTRDELLKMKYKDLIPGDNSKNLYESLQSELFPFIHTGTWKHKKKDGSLIDVEITGSYINGKREKALLVTIEETADNHQNERINSLLASIIESSDDAILSKTLSGIITSWNNAADRLYGYSAAEIIGKPVTVIIPPDIKDEFYSIMNKINKGELIERYETVRVRKDGRHINVSITISPIKDSSGKIIGASSIAHDVTQAKKMEYERRIREKQLLEAQQIAHLGYWELDIVTHALEWSDELYKIYGFDRSQRKITYDDYLLCIHPDDRSMVNSAAGKAQIDFQPFQFDHRIILRDGSLKFIHGVGEVLFDEENKPIKLRGIGQDITDRKRAERRLASQFEVTRIFVEAKNLVEASPKILQTICEGTDWQIGELWLVDFESNLLMLDSSWNVPNIPSEEFIKISNKCKFGPGVSLQGRVWESGKSSWSNNSIEDQFFPRAALAAKLRLHTALAFPVRYKNNVLGVIALYRDDSTEPDKELLKMLDSLGQQIGEFIYRKQAEPSLRESENLYKTLVEISPDAITYTNLSGRIAFCNLKAAQLFGFSTVNELTGLNLYAFIAHEDQKHAIENEHDTIKAGQTKNVEYMLMKKDKTKFPAEINTSIVLNSEGKPKAFIGIIRDISSRKINY